MERRPGTPSLLRELNDRAALDLLLPGTPLTRTQISEQTRVSKVTVAQMLTRLEERGLVAVVGQQEGGRGPNAALYSVVPSSAYVAGLYVDMDVVSAGVADVTGRVVAEVSVNPAEAANPVELVRGAVDRACRTAGVEMSRLSAFVIGSPGVVNPRTGDPQLAVNLPDWHEGVLDSLRGALARPVIIENDVNLAALAERSAGAARDLDDFVLVWIGVGLGMAAFLGGKLHRGAVGAAGEIGYLPVPGAPLQEDVRHPANGGLQSLVGANVVRMLAGVFGFAAPTAEEAVSAAVQAAAVSSANGPALNGPALNGPALNGSGATVARAEEFLSEIARRVALGVASVSVVLDPGLVVLGGNVGLAGGSALADRVAAEVARICPASPRVVPTAVSGAPVLRGAMLAAVDQARGDLLDSV
ncbi:MAG TPA: ROK family transcriptional regulator [Streptosporangiaceae bacterium]|nr:ROK family transcriptional regulator [Streptosporangiaceae bacterium]